MSISADYHLHTSFSTDSKTPMEDMILAGISKGLKTMCFTEHLDYDYPVPDDDPTFNFLLDMDAYLSKTKELADKYANKCEILFGVELGIQTHLAEKIRSSYTFLPF